MRVHAHVRLIQIPYQNTIHMAFTKRVGKKIKKFRHFKRISFKKYHLGYNGDHRIG